jgi:hypothetical protein
LGYGIGVASCELIEEKTLPIVGAKAVNTPIKQRGMIKKRTTGNSTAATARPLVKP